MFEMTGVATEEMVKSVFPSIERLNKGPVAVIECYKNIPCNPCATACRRNAIQEFKDINDRPNMDSDLCNGCTLCVSRCPGLAIMVVDGSRYDDKVIFKIPYEFLPLPNEGDTVQGLNRAGDYITDVIVTKIQNTSYLDRTPIISVEVDRRFLYEFRNIRLGE